MVEIVTEEGKVKRNVEVEDKFGSSYTNLVLGNKNLPLNVDASMSFDMRYKLYKMNNNLQ